MAAAICHFELGFAPLWDHYFYVWDHDFDVRKRLIMLRFISEYF